MFPLVCIPINLITHFSTILNSEALLIATRGYNNDTAMYNTELWNGNKRALFTERYCKYYVRFV